MFYTKAKVLYDFNPESAQELACLEGDTVCIAQEDSGDGWCVCFHPNSPEIQVLHFFQKRIFFHVENSSNFVIFNRVLYHLVIWRF